MVRKSNKRLIALGLLLFCAILLARGISAEGKSSQIAGGENTFGKLNPEKITTKWNDSYLFNSNDDALKDLEALKKRPEEINETFRPKFENLSGPILLDYLETEEDFLKRFEVLYTHAFTQNSKNVNDPFFISLLADSQNLSTDYEKANGFVTVKLKSLNKEEWEKPSTFL